jgi:serine protease Do
MQVFREGKMQQFNIKLGTLPESGQPGAPGQGGGAALRGLAVQDLTDTLAQQFGLPPGAKGVVITRVDPTSGAAVAGLQRGDVILEVNHQQIQNVQEYQKAIAGKANQPILLLISRGGETSFIVVQPQG